MRYNQSPDQSKGFKSVPIFSFQVTPNDVVQSIKATGANALPEKVIESSFSGMCGKTLNLQSFKKAVGQLDKWYQDNGVVGQVRLEV